MTEATADREDLAETASEFLLDDAKLTSKRTARGQVSELRRRDRRGLAGAVGHRHQRLLVPAAIAIAYVELLTQMTSDQITMQGTEGDGRRG